MTSLFRSITVLIMASGLILAGLATGARAEDCEAGRILYARAMEQSSPEKRIGLLTESITLCRAWRALYQLGKARMQTGELRLAEAALREAWSVSGTKPAEARALAKLGQIYQAENRTGEAVILYKQSLRLLRGSGLQTLKLEERLKALELASAGTGMSVDNIRKMLTFKGFNIEPSMDVRILFEFDRADLTPEGREMTLALGRALIDPAFDRKPFRITGHTDRRGGEGYNQGLSVRRASAVVSRLERLHPGLRGRLIIEGRGESELLYTGGGEDDHALNRRVEITLVQ